jgi:hypothetical protein
METLYWPGVNDVVVPENLSGMGPDGPGGGWQPLLPNRLGRGCSRRGRQLHRHLILDKHGADNFATSLGSGDGIPCGARGSGHCGRLAGSGTNRAVTDFCGTRQRDQGDKQGGDA